MPHDTYLKPLSEADRELIRTAQETIAANADDLGRHTVGAAVRDSDGKLHAGVNLAHFTGGPCAELVALAAARAAGGRELSTIVAVRRDGSVLGPCGRDRQVLLDYHPDIEVVLPFEPVPMKIAARHLLPWGAPWSPSTGTRRPGEVDPQPPQSSW